MEGCKGEFKKVTPPFAMNSVVSSAWTLIVILEGLGMDKKAMKVGAARVYMGLRRAEWDAPKARVALTKAEKKEVETLWGGGYGQSPIIVGMSTIRP